MIKLLTYLVFPKFNGTAVSINLKNQDYYLELGDIGNGLSWISDEKPFKLPVDLDELYLRDNKGFASKEALVSRVKELEAKGE